MSHVATIVLNWNNAADTAECLRSLEQCDAQQTVIVVDNGSTDGSGPTIRQQFPDITVLETGRNLGYAGGNNVGIRHALKEGADYLCILNNDVTVAADFLLPLVQILDEQSDAGIATPLVLEMANARRVWALGLAIEPRTGTVERRHANEHISDLHVTQPVEVDIASGTAMLVRREVYEDVGFMDEAYYLYFEEAHWCKQVRQAGYRILAAPSSMVWHKVSGTLGQASPLTDYYMLRNQLRFIALNWRGMQRSYLLGRTVLRNLLATAAFTVKSHNGRRLPNRNARLLALRDAARGRWGEIDTDVAARLYG